jgi:hypothetical protein
MSKDKPKKIQNSEEEYNDALASDDPTQVSTDELENLAKEAVKKFKSLS